MSDVRIPEGYRQVTPYLVVPDVRAEIDFLREVLGATVTVEPLLREDGTVMHTELMVGDARIMMSGTTDGITATRAMHYVYVNDVEERYAAALSAGASSIMKPADTDHGDRMAGVRDANGNAWYFAQLIPKKKRKKTSK